MDASDTVLGDLFSGGLEEHIALRGFRLWTQGLAAVLIAFMICYLQSAETSGLISIFLVAATLRAKLIQLFRENRALIHTHRVPSVQANHRTALSLLSLCAGAFTGYMLVCIYLLPDDLEAAFGFALHTLQLDPEASLLDPQRFEHCFWMLGNNLKVAFGIFFLGFFYRAYGTAVVLCWNAMAWSTALVMLGFGTSASHAVSPAYLMTVAFIAIAPHLLAEAFGYCIVAISAIVVSKAITRDKPSLRQELEELGPTVRRLLLTAVGFLTLGVVLEAYYAPTVLYYLG